MWLAVEPARSGSARCPYPTRASEPNTAGRHLSLLKPVGKFPLISEVQDKGASGPLQKTARWDHNPGKDWHQERKWNWDKTGGQLVPDFGTSGTVLVLESSRIN